MIEEREKGAVSSDRRRKERAYSH